MEAGCIKADGVHSLLSISFIFFIPIVSYGTLSIKNQENV